MDLYQVLDVTPEEALETDILKRKYKEALINSHPDKGKPTNYTVDTVRKAFDILSDPDKKQTYDKAINTAKPPASVTEIIDLDDMQEHEEESCTKWTRQCRCGEAEGYTVTEQDLVDNGNAEEINLQCVGCSIWIKVQYAEE